MKIAQPHFETTSKLLVVATVIFIVCSCTNYGAVTVKEHFDESTYTAVIRANRAVLFIARNQAISAHGGDMISIGPVYTVLSTTHKQALWFGFWTTLDRHNDGSAKFDAPTGITLSLDGIDIGLEEDKRFAGKEGNNWQSYPAPAPGTVNRYFLVTDEELQKISDASVVSLRVSDENQTETVYHAQSRLTPIVNEFLKHVK